MPTGSGLVERDQLERERSVPRAEYPHRVPWLAPACRGAAGVEDLKAAIALVQGDVGVAEDDGVAAGKGLAQPCESATRGPGVADSPAARAVQPELEALWETHRERGLIDVARDGSDRWTDCR